jgi:hypothetical protein
MITSTGIKLPDFELLSLGDRVKYHHRCQVIRCSLRLHLGLSVPPEDRYYWFFPSREVGHVPPVLHGDPYHKYPAERSGKGTVKYNKSIYIWPEEGTGIITGVVRRGIGYSEPTSGGQSGYDWDDFNPGGFSAETWVWLYTIKSSIYGTQQALVPIDAVSLVD